MYSMTKLTVLVETRPFCAFNAAPMNKLKSSGMRIIDLRGSGIEDADFINALRKADAILCGNELHVNQDLFDLAPKLKVVAKLGAGKQRID